MPLLLLLGCPADPTPAVTLPKPDPAQLEQWNRLVRGMRMDLMDDSGKIVREHVTVLELRSTTQPTVIALWASYCPPCLEEMTMLDSLHGQSTVIGVSLDAEDVEAAARAVAERSPGYPQGILLPWSARRVGRALPEGVPFTLVLDREGKVRHFFPHATTKALLEAAIEAARS